MSRSQMLHIAWAGTFSVVGVLALGHPARGDEADARRRLVGQGLTQLRSHWICRDEIMLRRQLARLPGLEREFNAARREVQSMIVELDGYRERLEELQAIGGRLRQRLDRDSLSLSVRGRVEKDLLGTAAAATDIQGKIREDLNGRDETSLLTLAAVRLVNARSTLAMAILAIDRHTLEMNEEYALLGADETIAKSLGAVGPLERLGPAEVYEGRDRRRRIDRLSAEIFSDHVPVYLRSGHFRLSVVVGDQTPATFSYRGDQPHTIIPATLVQSAGIEIDTSRSPDRLFDSGLKRTILVHKVTIPKLRIGEYVLENVAALALESGGEDLGAVLGRDALADYRVELDPRRLDFRMTPLE